jgi:hypothetical protein
MPKYLVEASYTAEGINGLQSEGGSARVSATKALIENLGGTLECFYFALGDTTPSSWQICRTTQRSPQCRWPSTAAERSAHAPLHFSHRARSTRPQSGTCDFTRQQAGKSFGRRVADPAAGAVSTVMALSPFGARFGRRPVGSTRDADRFVRSGGSISAARES